MNPVEFGPQHLNLIRIVESTLREGRQGFGVSIGLEQSLDYARKISNLGFEYIEMTHLGSSPVMAQIIDRAVDESLRSRIAVHIPARDDDLNLALESKAEVFHIYVPMRDPKSVSAVNDSIERGYNAIRKALPRINENHTEVRVSLEHGLDLPIEVVGETYRQITTLDGITRVGLAETTGIHRPRKVIQYAKAIFDATPTDIPLELHVHNDTGLAAAKIDLALELVAQTGRRIDIDVSFGVGDRNAIPSIGDVLSMLYASCGPEELQKRYNIKKYWELYLFVEQQLKLPISPRDPLSRWAFTSSAGPHLAAGVNGNGKYHLIHPEHFGAELFFNVGHPVTGTQGIKYFIEKKLEMTLSEDEYERLAQLVRTYTAETRALDDQELGVFLKDNIQQ